MEHVVVEFHRSRAGRTHTARRRRSRRTSDAGRTLPLNGLGRGAGLACTTASGGANDGMQWGAWSNFSVTGLARSRIAVRAEQRRRRPTAWLRRLGLLQLVMRLVF